MAVYGLIDGNSFYYFCEQAFDPTLRDKPVVVLPINDGCVIARWALAKAVGIKMGDGDAGFRPRTWYVDVREAKQADEIAYRKADVLSAGREPQVRRITAYDWFSKRG